MFWIQTKKNVFLFCFVMPKSSHNKIYEQTFLARFRCKCLISNDNEDEEEEEKEEEECVWNVAKKHDIKITIENINLVLLRFCYVLLFSSYLEIKQRRRSRKKKQKKEENSSCLFESNLFDIVMFCLSAAHFPTNILLSFFLIQSNSIFSFSSSSSSFFISFIFTLFSK